MKKIIIGVLTGIVLLGGATYTSAAANNQGEGLFNFGQMKPYIEEMHPNLSTKEQKEMFDNCHGEDGFMQNSNNEARNMMNNY